MSGHAIIAGVGMIPFTKPGSSEPYPQMAAKATRAALADAGIGYELIEEAYVGYVYGDSTFAQRALYQVGMTGIPIVNVNNNCATGLLAAWRTWSRWATRFRLPCATSAARGWPT